MGVIEIKNCKKILGNNEVLKNINLSFEEGKVTCIIGSSGSGKSTFLRICSFLEKMDAGTLFYKGNCLYEINNNKLVSENQKEILNYKNKISLVFQNFNLYPHFTVLKNIIDAPIIVQKRNKEEVIEEAKKILDKVGLIEKINDYPKSLSGGQQQRVAIARALMMKPEILFFDEPTSALDPELTNDVLKVIKSLVDMHYTMVIVTHEMNFAKSISDSIVFLDNGVIIEEGSPKYIFEDCKNEKIIKFLQNYE